MKSILATSLSLALLAIPSALSAAGPLAAESPTLKITPLADGLHLAALEGSVDGKFSGNILISTGPDGVLLVDSGLSALSASLKEAVMRAGGGKVRFVINTHPHLDHSGGDEQLRSRGALVLGQAPPVPGMTGRTGDADPDRDITYAGTMTLHWNGDKVSLLHPGPAHSTRDTLVHFSRANVIHMGDTFIRGYPFFDVKGGGSLSGLMAAADLALARSDEETVIVRGHGPPVSRRELQAWREMLSTVRERVRSLVKAGRTEEEIVEAAPTRGYDATLGRGFMGADSWVRLIVRSESGQGAAQGSAGSTR